MKTLIVLLGPTGVGKTDLSLSLAEHLRSPIISCDSRQIFRELPIGTAAPTAEEQARVKHYFIGTHSVTDNYNAGQYEADALTLLEQLFPKHDTLLMVGGSMLYIDAVCRGLDDIPHVSPETRQQVQQAYAEGGIEALQSELQALDPVYFSEVDKQNPQRLMHAIEICRETGKPFSAFRTGTKKQRPFRIVKVGLNRDRDQLYQRINLRVEQMLAAGLEEEVRAVYPHKHLNSLNTVGYKEIFRYFDGEYPREEAIRLIKQDSRHYAKRQLTWFNRDTDIHWFNPTTTTVEQILQLL